MSLQRAQELASAIASTIEGRAAPRNLRGSIAAGSFDTVCEHHRAVNLLVQQRIFGSAFALLRAMYDGCILGLWARYVATEPLLSQFEAGRYTPEPHKVLKHLKKYDDGSYVKTLERVHTASWKVLSCYVHGGHLQVSRRNAIDFIGPNYADDEISELLIYSNAMAVIAAMEIPDLTGDESFAIDMMTVNTKYASTISPSIIIATDLSLASQTPSSPLLKR